MIDNQRKIYSSVATHTDLVSFATTPAALPAFYSAVTATTDASASAAASDETIVTAVVGVST